MRSETIRVKKPAWVRIVNPDPIVILGMTWSYGSLVLLKPGGVFRTITESDRRTLAMYQPPHAPSDPNDAPPDALVYRTVADLRLLAEGVIEDQEPYDVPVPRHAPQAPAAIVKIGDRARVPKSRRVHATPPHAIRTGVSGGPYREETVVERLNRLSEWRTIRPGGTMTVFTFGGEPPSALLKVQYRAAAGYADEQCEDGMWFHIPESEFIRMGEEYRQTKELEEHERAVVISVLRSF